jgi:hypothetical protein
MPDELTPEETLLLIDALQFNGYEQNLEKDKRRLFFTHPYTDWLSIELTQKLSRIHQTRARETYLAEQKAEYENIKQLAKKRATDDST